MAGLKNISIKNRLIVIQSATAFFAVLMCCGIFVLNDLKIYRESEAGNKFTIAEVIAENSISPLVFQDRDAENRILANMINNPSILNAKVLDKSGKEFAHYAKSGEENFSFPAIKGPMPTSLHFDEKKFTISYKIYQDKEFVGTILIRSELTDWNKMINDYIKIALLVMFASLLAAFFISIVLQRSISGRLLKLVAKAKEVSEKDDYSVRVTAEGNDEITGLSENFNEMMETIQRMEQSLRQANYELEKRVNERTLQLSGANQHLLAEVSQRKEAEEEVKKLNSVLQNNVTDLERANKDLESFSYSISHDLRAPLRAINGFAKILEQKYDNKIDEEGKRYLHIVENNVKKMSELIDDLLSFSRLGKKELLKTNVDMQNIVTTLVNEIDKSQYNANAEIIVKNILPCVGDATLLNQVFFNLLSNALKYSRKKEKPLIEIGSRRIENENVYYVKDNGVGFNMEYYDKLFKVFQRLHSAEEFEGSGVGLAIVHRIITRHGGKVWAESKEGEGATFYFSLPAD